MYNGIKLILHAPVTSDTEKYSDCREFLVESAKKVGIEGAAEFLEDPNNGLKEVFSFLIHMIQLVMYLI